MSIFSGLDEIVETDYPLAGHTWYGLGGPADYFIRPRTVDQLKEAVQRCNENNIRTCVMGFGSNLLISDDGVRAAVLKLEGEQFAQTEFDGEQLIAWAGADLRKLVRTCVKKGLSGLEGLTGIPSSIGGAVRMNAGGRFGDIGAAVESVTLMDNQGNVFEKNKPELMFDYRRTNITAKFILSATLKLNAADPDQILRTVKEVWVYKENSQPPLNTRNAGCVFKNPRGISAGALIDRAGLKGLQIGGAVVSEKHANFIIAEEGCTSRDVMRLIDAIRQRVKQQFDIELELEIELWN
ncbi:MAG TPA: UDP-N-acetylmuramate dehydrogenase [Sedimentisphaerales bacterium]|nr:UDP-N-acetylmuramate dehydrogenase [Sedimentisphaerales bacterium]